MAMQVFHNSMQLSVNLLQQPVMALAKILKIDINGDGYADFAVSNTK